MKWKDLDRIPNFQVSEYGQILNCKTGKIRKQRIYKQYKTVTIIIDKKAYFISIHVAVAKAFIPNPLNLPEVDHIDKNKLNNYYKNLRWSTRKDNCSNKRINNNSLYFDEEINKFVLYLKADETYIMYDELDEVITAFKKSIHLA